jgi:hypothetical protein
MRYKKLEGSYGGSDDRMLKGEMLQQEKGLILYNLEGILQLLAFLSLHIHSLDRDGET